METSRQIEIVARLDEASLTEGSDSSSVGISPSRCPAIRDAGELGIVVASPCNIRIGSKHDAFVQVLGDSLGNRCFVPGVIGDPKSRRAYARVDTGYSFTELPCQVLSLPPLQFLHRETLVFGPTVLYPVGYSGPVLAALASNRLTEIKKGEPLVQLTPLAPASFIAAVADGEIEHPGFSGLLRRDWKTWTRLGSASPEQLWDGSFDPDSRL